MPSTMLLIYKIFKLIDYKNKTLWLMESIGDVHHKGRAYDQDDETF